MCAQTGRGVVHRRAGVHPCPPALLRKDEVQVVYYPNLLDDNLGIFLDTALPYLKHSSRDAPPPRTDARAPSQAIRNNKGKSGKPVCIGSAPLSCPHLSQGSVGAPQCIARLALPVRHWGLATRRMSEHVSSERPDKWGLPSLVSLSTHIKSELIAEFSSPPRWDVQPTRQMNSPYPQGFLVTRVRVLWNP